MKKIFLSFVSFISISCFAQNNSMLCGFLKDAISHQPLAFASITNMNLHETVLSNKNGFFKIPISQNQLISFASVGYNFDTILVNKKMMKKDTLHLFLSPLTLSLEGVTVVGKIKYSAYQLDSLKRRKDFFSTMSEHTQPTFSLANSGAGLGVNLDYFYNREKRKRKRINLFDQMEQEQYINYRFTPTLVNKYAILTADSLITFVQEYRPTYIWLRKHIAEEDVLYYVNDKLKLFFKRKK